ncbi:hypothetical protein, partial [Pseudoalteromonas sp. MMG012]|uniref:hypothetical protein n=1 Tax=Pseudoalteromonas sp. MMG012 TaxID=2822686 RepID=UPI001B3A68EE
MKSISLLLLLLCTLGAQSKAQGLEPQFNLYFKKNTLETLNLNDIQRSTLQAIIQNAELDKQVDAEYANGTKGVFGDLSRTVPYTGNEIFNIAINSGKIDSENFTLKPIYLAYGRDLNLRRIEFESKIKGVRARLHIFMEGEGKFASTQ